MKKRPILFTLICTLALAACTRAPALPEAAAATAEAQQTPTPQAAILYVPILAVNTSDPSKGMVYLEDPATGERSPYLDLSDLYSDHYHPVEYQAGNLFVIRRFDYTGPGDDDWRSELWVYDAAKNGSMVFASKSLDFRASPDGMTIAVSDNERLYLMDTGGNAFAQLSAPQLAGSLTGAQDASIDLEGWSNDGTRFWGNLSAASQVLGFYKTNATGGEVKSYDLSGVPFSVQEYALNPNNGKIVFSDYPRFFDADSAERFNGSGTTVTLYLLDLNGMVLTSIVTNTAAMFNPKWGDDEHVQYDDPGIPGQRLEYAVR
jgi:hypothetical protein